MPSVIVERVTTQPRLSLVSAVYNSACILPGARGGRGVRAVGVATLNSNFRKKQRINAKSEPSKGSGLAISRRRQIYAMIGVELRTLGEIFVKT